MLWGNQDHVPQLWKPMYPEPVLLNNGSLHNEKPAHRSEEQPDSPQLEKACEERQKPRTCMLAKVLQSCATLGDLQTVARQARLSRGIVQARILEWVSMPSSRGSSRPRDRTRVFCGFCLAGGFFATEILVKPQRLSVANNK